MAGRDIDIMCWIGGVGAESCKMVFRSVCWRYTETEQCVQRMIRISMICIDLIVTRRPNRQTRLGSLASIVAAARSCKPPGSKLEILQYGQVLFVLQRADSAR